jgi:PAS domain S-box-containing protein
VIAQVFDTSQEGIFITDAHTRFISVNQSFTRITGYSTDDVAGQTPRILSSGRQNKAFYQGMWAAIEADGRWEGEIWNRRKTGEIYPSGWSSVPSRMPATRYGSTWASSPKHRAGKRPRHASCGW